MKRLHSSISSSESEPAAGHDAETPPPLEGRTLEAFPWPTPAFWYALVTFLAIGIALGHIGGWSHGAPPSSLHLDVSARAYLYNVENRPRNADVLLFGDSLMELGIISDRLAGALDLEPAEVKNLALAGARPWDVEWLIERLDEPKTDGPKLAVIQIDRTWFDLGWSPVVNYGRAKILEDPQAEPKVGELDQVRGRLNYWIPERRQMRSWLNHAKYDWLAYLKPGLVPVPVLVSPEVWDLPPEVQKRAVNQVATQARKSLEGPAFADHTISAIRLMVETLKKRSYRVVLFLAPLRHDTLAQIEASPAALEREQRMRAAIAQPPYLGADRFVEHRDSDALDSEDDAIFLDYGHLNRTGAERQTARLAETIRELGLLEPQASSPRLAALKPEVSTQP